MLTEDDIARIRLEEELRRKIQEDFAKNGKPKSPWRRFLDFFESSLGKWLLTSVLAAFVTLLFNFGHYIFNKTEIDKESRDAGSRRDAELVMKVVPQLQHTCAPAGLAARAVLTALSTDESINKTLKEGLSKALEIRPSATDAANVKPLDATCRAALAAIDGRPDFDNRQAQSTALANATPTPASGSEPPTLIVEKASAANMVMFQVLSRVVTHEPTVDSGGAIAQKTISSRVYIQIQGGTDQKTLADKLTARLSEAQLIVPGIEALPIAKMPNQPQVRYFADADRAVAEQVVAAAKSALPDIPFQAVRVKNLPAPAGTLEVWFKRQE